MLGFLLSLSPTYPWVSSGEVECTDVKMRVVMNTACMGYLSRRDSLSSSTLPKLRMMAWGEGRLRAGAGLFDKQLWARSLLRDGMIIIALRAVPVTNVLMCVILLASIRFAR